MNTADAPRDPALDKQIKAILGERRLEQREDAQRKAYLNKKIALMERGEWDEFDALTQAENFIHNRRFLWSIWSAGYEAGSSAGTDSTREQEFARWIASTNIWQQTWVPSALRMLKRVVANLKQAPLVIDQLEHLMGLKRKKTRKRV